MSAAEHEAAERWVQNILIMLEKLPDPQFDKLSTAVQRESKRRNHTKP